MENEHLKKATCSPSDGVAVNDTKMLRGTPSPTTPAWNDTNETKQFVTSGKNNMSGAENNLNG